MRRASNKITAGSVELCETEVCFSHIQLMGTNVRVPKTHQIPPEGDLNLHGPQQNQSLGTIPFDNAVQCLLPTWQHCLWSLV